MNTENQGEEDFVLPARAAEARDNVPLSPLKRRLSMLHWRAHCLAPSLVMHPGGEVDFDPERDQQENEDTGVGSDCELRSPIIWGVELYGPAEIGSLYASLRSLAWSRAGGWKAEHDAANQIRRMRLAGTGAWVNLGIVRSRASDTSPPFDKNFAGLPEGVDCLIVSASQITPSLTALVIGFQLKEFPAQHYELELNKDRRTLRQRTPGAWSMEWVTPSRQKELAVSALRSGRRTMVGAWLARNLPGYFCGLSLGQLYPTMELLVANGLNLRDEELGGRASRSWQNLLMSPSPFESWDSPKCPGLQIGLERNFEENTGCHVYITLDSSVLPAAELEGYGGPSLRAYSFYCDRMFTNLLVQIGAIEFLKSHAQDLHAAREHLKIRRAESRDVAKSLDEIGRFFDRTLGAPAIVRELAVYSEQETWFRRSCGDFGVNAWDDDGDRRMLYADVQRGIHARSTRLADDEVALRTHFEQITTVLSVQESVRLQRWTLTLTLLALAIALGSLMTAIYGPPGSKLTSQPDIPEKAGSLGVAATLISANPLRKLKLLGEDGSQ